MDTNDSGSTLLSLDYVAFIDSFLALALFALAFSLRNWKSPQFFFLYISTMGKYIDLAGSVTGVSLISNFRWAHSLALSLAYFFVRMPLVSSSPSELGAGSGCTCIWVGPVSPTSTILTAAHNIISSPFRYLCNLLHCGRLQLVRHVRLCHLQVHRNQSSRHHNGSYMAACSCRLLSVALERARDSCTRMKT